MAADALVAEHISDADLARAGFLVGLAQNDLLGKGYTPSQAQAATARAWGTADHWTKQYSAALRGRAFLELLTHELGRSESWIRQEIVGMTNHR